MSKFQELSSLIWSVADDVLRGYRILSRIEEQALRMQYLQQAIVRYSVLAENKKLFASKYRLYLPGEEELKQLIERKAADHAKDACNQAGKENTSDKPCKIFGPMTG